MHRTVDAAENEVEVDMQAPLCLCNLLFLSFKGFLYAINVNHECKFYIVEYFMYCFKQESMFYSGCPLVKLLCLD